MVVERRHFLPHLTSSNEVALRMIEVLCQRLRDTSETLGNFAMLDLPGRLARKLLNLAAEYGNSANGRIRLEIRLSHTDLGRFVGCSRGDGQQANAGVGGNRHRGPGRRTDSDLQSQRTPCGVSPGQD